MSRVKSFRELLATGAAQCGALVDELLAAAMWSAAPLRAARIAAMKPAHESGPPRA